MKVVRGTKAIPWLGAALFAALFAMPDRAAARPYEPQDLPTPEGDPTADDQPSPTPKGGRYSANRMIVTSELSSSSARRGSLSKLIWLAYVRTWIRISLR
jgi:hypothetical protein